MTVPLSWSEICIRILCAIVVAGLMGLNRSEHGHAAGLRTSILVCLAACVAMIQVNWLLPLAGRSPDSFVMNDLMRLPLGILSGMGFIGAGAIVRRDDLVVGITTAASLWFLTVIGLCFGGGQIGLGFAGGGVGILLLIGLKGVEHRMRQDRQAVLRIVTGGSGPGEEEIRTLLQHSGFQVSSCAFATTHAGESREWNCVVRWQGKPQESTVPEVVRSLITRDGVIRIAWTPQAR
jgi:putative Mg2+ transporter-C (MgtC) family protein